MRVESAIALCFLGIVGLSQCAPPTCYSRALSLSKEVMTLLDKIHTYHRTKTCAEVLPVIFLDVHNSCITTKLRDFLYVLVNHPSQYCRERPRIVLLKTKIQNFYAIITRICYRVSASQITGQFFLQLKRDLGSLMLWQDLVFFTDDCEAIDTGHSRPHYAEDRLQLLQEER
ncbi:cytokine-like protein 1 isoform X1 [Corythoichthys intestinalis]|uniref:cytokine-like protein 1 isoform X1 n=1 Tax=Corythoichthys intestinalis TaxID=161448 RepID=UPI0025A50CC7|nr:cytokine-like protein 1 isoform X1 [Corythoichthys intestinalis]